MKYIDAILQWLSVQNNITFLIAIAGFGMSIYNFVYSIVQDRTRVEAEVSHVFRAGSATKCVEVINLRILNLSKIPVVLSRVTVKNYLRSGSFGSYRRKIYTHTVRSNGNVESQTIWTSDQLPIKIEGNGCVNLLLIADDKEPLLAANAENTFQLHTAKKTVCRNVHITNFSHFELLSECREPDFQ